ncbi:hypothetical protein ZIOFF_071150 [Zingiber officinale]|uniref:Reverse transcriptase Ty1/copia-type domain-containing protein n=1 Tax=Zingiber officinale TaxID=94328 RepID=A0A8J5BDY3_ZINOF|nr:hypothetical protein ZIOFF_071150 [Zingiber officinale]
MRSDKFPDHVCHLYKALYGLKQAPCTWYLELCAFLDGTLIYFLVYVDDLIITGSDASSVDIIVCKLHAKFEIKDLGALSLFGGVEVRPTSNGLLLSQQKYVFVF